MALLILSLGWASGALVNYIADVLPRKRSFVRPFCLNCGVAQGWINYSFWPRRCPSCGKRRAWRIWAIEIAAVGLTLWLWFHQPAGVGFLPGIIILIYFAIVVVIDIETHLILHLTSIVGCVLGLIYGIINRGLWTTVLGGLAGLGLILFLYVLGILFVRYIINRSRPEFSDEALGFGDVILGTVLGLFLGWPAILLGLFLAILFAGGVSLIYLAFTLLARRYKAFTFIPYGPFLIAGAATLIFFREQILRIFGR
jgi:leader peptidase (prepilin peptidase)/N-methyltransferase